MREIPYARVVLGSLGATAALASLLKSISGDWIAAMYLSVVAIFTVITIVLIAQAVIVAIIDWIRRRREDPPGGGQQNDYGLAA